MTTARRYDIQKLDKMTTTPQGFLKFDVFAGRTGIQLYKNAEGKLKREYRPPEEVFSEDTMSTLKSAPMVNDHPDKMVDVTNAKDLMIGFTGENPEKVDEIFQKNSVIVFDKDAINDINSGKVEVSLGYDVDLDETPGQTDDGLPFDAIQRNIRINHLALVDRGRGGSEVRLRLDSMDAIMVDEDETKKPYAVEDDMPKVKIGDEEFEVEQKTKDAFEAEMKKGKDAAEEAEKEKDAAEEEKKEVDADLEEEKKKADGLQAKVDGLTEDLKKKKVDKMDSKEVQKLVQERQKLEKVATKVLDAESVKVLDSMTDMDIKTSVIEAESKDVKLDGKSDEYINARFDHIADNISKSGDETDEASAAFKADREKKKDSEGLTEAQKKRNDAQDKTAKAWQEPIGRTAANK